MNPVKQMWIGTAVFLALLMVFTLLVNYGVI
jgi:hypothetical protein